MTSRKPWLIFGLLVLLWLEVGPVAGQPARGPTAPGPASSDRRRWTTRVEERSSTAGRSVVATRNAGIKRAKDQAIQDYLSAIVPPAMLEGKEEVVKKLLEQRDRLVISIENNSERIEGETLIMTLSITVDRERLDALLRAQGLLPSRELPKTFIAARANDRGEEQKSAWDFPAGSTRDFNLCESRLAGTFAGYGFAVIDPHSAAGAIDVDQAVEPRGRDDLASAFRQVRKEFGAETMVVAFAESAVVETSSDGGEVLELAVRIAVCDLDQGRIVFSDRVHDRARVKGAIARGRALQTVCDRAAQRAVEALFASLSGQGFTAGAERPIALTVQGVNSYAAMKEIEKKLRDEGPGVVKVNLVKLGTNEIMFEVTTTVEAKTLAEWIAKNRAGDLVFKIVSTNDNAVSVFASPAP